MPKNMQKLKEKRKKAKAERANRVATNSMPNFVVSSNVEHVNAVAAAVVAPAPAAETDAKVNSEHKENDSLRNTVPASSIARKGFFYATQDGAAILLNGITPTNIIGLFTERLKTCIGIFVFGSKGMALIHDTGMLTLSNIDKIFSAVGNINACVIAYNPDFDKPMYGSTHQDKISRIMPVLKRFKVDRIYEPVKTTCGQAWALNDEIMMVKTHPLATENGIQPLHMEVRHWINIVNNFFQKPDETMEPDLQLAGADLYDVPRLLKSPKLIQGELKFHVSNAAKVLGGEVAGKARVDEMLNIHRIFWAELNLDADAAYPDVALRKKEFQKIGLKNLDDLELWLRKQDARRAERRRKKQSENKATNAAAAPVATAAVDTSSSADAKKQVAPIHLTKDLLKHTLTGQNAAAPIQTANANQGQQSQQLEPRLPGQ